MGDLSAHFSSSEFADKRTGDIVVIDRELLSVLERIRSRIGRPLPVVSGYRSPATNRAAGGARRSYHLRGMAADLPAGLVRLEDAIAAGARGIGVCGGWVVHVDSRRTTRPVIFKDCPSPRS